MNDLFNLYKTHIGGSAVDFHQLTQLFGVNFIYIKHPNDKKEEILKQRREEAIFKCKKYILENSKTLNNNKMSDKTTLGDRMKSYYEDRTRFYLTRRLPIIIRLDGKSFHTYTKGLDKPFDEGLMEDMKETTKFLCENIMGAKCGYTQSDEISILVTDFDKEESQAWFDNNVQKMCSIAASLATAKFNELRVLRTIQPKYLDEVGQFDSNILKSKLAFFDARVFQIPEFEEVVNYFIWRQRDAERNSISALAQSLFSHKELNKKNTSQMQDMCWEKGQNWNDLSINKKRGSFITKQIFVNDKLVIKRESGDFDSIATKDLLEDPEIGDLWYQPDNLKGFYPNKKGRLLRWTKSEDRSFETTWDDWCDIPIEKIRTKWDSVETPIFSKSRESILNLLK